MPAQPKIPNATGRMPVTEARLWVRDNFDTLLNDYQAGFKDKDYVTATRNEVRFLDFLIVRKNRQGLLEVLQRTDVDDTWTALPKLNLQNLANHLFEEAFICRLRLLGAQKLRDLTGRDYRLEHLTGLIKAAEEGRMTLLKAKGTNRYGWYFDPWPELRKFEKAVLDRLERDTVELLKSMHFNSFPASLYNSIRTHKAAWREIRRENEALLPFVKVLSDKGKIPLTPRAYTAVSQYVQSQGYPPRTWRTLFGLDSNAVLQLLGNFNQDAEKVLAFVHHFAEAGISPSGHHLNYALNLQRHNRNIPVWFDRAAADEVTARKAEAAAGGGHFSDYTFFYREYSTAADWLVSYLRGGNTPDKNQLKAGWKWIARMSEEWHEEQIVRRLSRHLKWESPVAAYRDGKFEVVPLISSEDLAREGARMHHCVGGYDSYCASGRSRIFSIRQDGRSKATVELIYHNNDWRINQSRGPCNADPGKILHAVAERLLKKVITATARKAAA